ncbi:MAG: 6-phosphogluconolactonase [Sulfuricellaceae bacterium]
MNTTTHPQTVRWHLYPSAEAVRKKAVAVIFRAAGEAIARSGVFRLVLAGGTTPQAVYEALREMPADWPKWQIWFGDERCLPPDHPERNSRMARDAWLDHVPLPAARIYAIPAELGAEAGAAAYAGMLRDVPEFDLVLLGLGEDGHTASLFPGQPWGADCAAPAALAVRDAPKPPAARISLSAWRLGLARQVIFLVTGTGKSAAVQRWRGGAELPASAVRPPEGVDVLVEQAVFDPA